MVSNNGELTSDETRKPAGVPWHKQLIKIRSTLIVILTPIVFLPVPLLSRNPVRNLRFVEESFTNLSSSIMVNCVHEKFGLK